MVINKFRLKQQNDSMMKRAAIAAVLCIAFAGCSLLGSNKTKPAALADLKNNN